MAIKKILLVEDNFRIQEIQKIQLELLGFQVIAAYHGLDALEIFQNNPDHFSLVFTDLLMPYMNGDELAHEIRQINPHVPIILATGHAEVETQHMLTDGIQAVMYKPYGLEQLVTEIDNLV